MGLRMLRQEQKGVRSLEAGRPGEAAQPGDQQEERKGLWVLSRGRGCICPHRGLGHARREQETQLCGQ